MDTNSLIPLGTVVIGALTLVVLIIALAKIAALSKLLTRLSEQIPGTGMTAKELASELGGSIDQAFKNYVPKPDALAAALGQAVESAGQQTAEQVKQANASLAESAKSLTEGLGGVGQELQNALQGAAAQTKDNYAEVIGAIQTALSQHATKLEAANQALAAQLDKIATLEKDIQEVLRVQQVVDGTMKTIATSESFTGLLTSIQSHLQESEKLLREAARPRTIRLVETEGEVSQG